MHAQTTKIGGIFHFKLRKQRLKLTNSDGKPRPEDENYI